MNLKKLMDILGIEAPDEFMYFDQMADLLEHDGNIPFDTFYNLLEETPAETLSEITAHYFEDILAGVHDDGVDFYTLLTNIGRSLEGLAENAKDADSRRTYAEELYRFRNWYNAPDMVIVESADEHPKNISILEALTLFRSQKLGGDEFAYDYLGTLDYPIEDFAVSLDYTVDMDSVVKGRSRFDDRRPWDEDDEDDELDRLYEDGLIHPEFPVIDGDFSDDEATPVDMILEK